MKTNTKKSIMSVLLAATMCMTGCGKKSECDIPTWHVHKYTKTINSTITIEKYIEDEHLKVGGYEWNEDYITINADERPRYEATKNLFLGENNWDYLYHLMATHPDYLEFYYEYWTWEYDTIINSDGKPERVREYVHKDGWHTDPRDSDNTGKTRVVHTRYVGRKLVNVNGGYRIEISTPVDDIGDIVYEYPYYCEKGTSYSFPYFIDGCIVEVRSNNMKFKRRELPYLRAEDITPFNQPDLSRTTLDDEKTRVK